VNAVAEAAVPAAEIDGRLIARYVAGDRDAFRQVFEELKREVWAVVRRYFRSAFDQEEAQQEVWIQLYRARDRFDLQRSTSFSGWVCQIARNRCVDLLRARARQAEIAVDGLEPADAPGQLDALADRRFVEAVEAVVSELDPEQYRFFQLCFVQECSHEEISERLSITVRRSKYLKKKLLARLLDSRRLHAARRR